VQRLQRDLAAATGWLVEAGINPSYEHGGGTFGENGLELEASGRITSPLINDQWRLFAGYAYANAHPPEGFVDRDRAVAGLSLSQPDWSGEASVHQDFGTLARLGAGGSVSWTPNDHVSLSASGDYISIETPLRALLYGITANSVGASASYSWNESRRFSLTGTWMPFTDGNQRFAAGAQFQQRLVSLPHFDLTGLAEIYASNNSRRNAPYYNPAARRSVCVPSTSSGAVTMRASRRRCTSWAAITASGTTPAGRSAASATSISGASIRGRNCATAPRSARNYTTGRARVWLASSSH
jgi:biofilm PGA synthesis protein PgaA